MNTKLVQDCHSYLTMDTAVVVLINVNLQFGSCGSHLVVWAEENKPAHHFSPHITRPPTDVHTYIHRANPMHRLHTRVVHTRSGSPQLLLLHTTGTGYTLKLGVYWYLIADGMVLMT